MIQFQEAVAAFDRVGFKNTHDLKRTAEFHSPAETPVYLVKDALLTGTLHVVIRENQAYSPTSEPAAYRSEIVITVQI